MKGNHWFIAGIIVFLVLMFAIECRLPKKFVWNPTFSHYDKQPFGCAVFDSLLSSSLPKGYSLSRKTFYELEQEDTTLRRGILVVTDNLHLTDVDVEAMLKMAGRGDRIMLAGSSFSRILKDTLGFECSYSYFSPSALKKYATALLSKDSLCWVGDSAVYPQQTFCFYPQLCQSYFFADSISSKVLAEKLLPEKLLIRLPCRFLGEKGKLYWLPLPCFLRTMVCWMGRMRLIFSYIVPDGWISHCPYRRLYERNSPGTDVFFSLFPFAAAASLGIVLEYGFHPALYDIYSPQEAARHSGYPRTGK